jgi:hypothetical protein
MLRKVQLPHLLILLAFLIFFGRLFYPEPKIYYTPDFSTSDIWHLHYPMKDFLARSLKSGQLPFWTKDIGTGFPLFAESQIGSLYVFNLILFSVFPTWFAWNLSYLVVFFLSFLGTYFFFRNIRLSVSSSIFAAFVFSFGGFFISHISHLTLLQAASLTPWLFLVGTRLWEKPSMVKLILFAVILSQQLLAGFVQISFISILGIFLFLVGQMGERNLEKLIKKIGLFGWSIVLALALAAPQLIPLWEYKNLTSRKQGLTQAQIFQYPYPLRNIITFILPNFFGTPRDGSYPSPFETDWGIYWENTAYLGLLPLAFALIAIFKRKKLNWEKSFLFLAIFSFLLVLGRASPLSFLFTYSGFNFFRVPSRFLLLATFSIAALSGVGFDMFFSFISREKRFTFIQKLPPATVLMLAVLDLLAFGYFNHPLVSVSEALEPPPILVGLPENSRMYSYHTQREVWNDMFFNNGWVDISPYLYFKNGLDANLNLVFRRGNVSYYSAFPTTRLYFQRKLLPKLFNTTAAEYIVSPTKLDEGEALELVYTVDPPSGDLPFYYVYLNKESLARFRMVSNYRVLKGIDELSEIFGEEDFPYEDTVLLESELGESFDELTIAEVRVVEDYDQRVVLRTNSDKKAILVVADSYYPDWRATINGKEVEILPANINQRAVVVPAGENTIEMYYYPGSFYKGVVISIGSFAVFVIFAIFKPQKKFRYLMRYGKKAKRKVSR